MALILLAKQWVVPCKGHNLKNGWSLVCQLLQRIYPFQMKTQYFYYFRNPKSKTVPHIYIQSYWKHFAMKTTFTSSKWTVQRNSAEYWRHPIWNVVHWSNVPVPLTPTNWQQLKNHWSTIVKSFGIVNINRSFGYQSENFNTNHPIPDRNGFE